MPRGYAGKILEIDLSSENIKETRIEENVLRQYIGRRGLAVKILYDSGVVCWFNFFDDKAQETLWDLLKAVTGWRITPEEWFNVTARRILHIQRAALLLGGPDLRWNPRVHDDVPSRWYEPLTKGLYSGKAVDKVKMHEEIKEYYTAVGWDNNGVPTSEELKRLGLEDVDERLERIRNSLTAF